MANDIYSWSKTANDNQVLDGLTWAEGTQKASTVNNSARQMMATSAGFRDSISGADTPAGTANAITLTSSAGFTSLGNGRIVAFKASADNTGATTLNVNSLGAKSVRKMTKAGDVALTGGEIQDDGIYIVQYSAAANSGAGGWILVNPTLQFTWGKGADVASASTLTLGDDGNYFDITGTTTITSIATKGVGTVVKLHFDAALVLTHHSADLVLPDGTNIITSAGDEAEFIEYAAGDWRCTSYTHADKSAIVASASTTNIGSTGKPFIHVTGTTTITAFDTANKGVFKQVVFDGVLTLTHNGTSLILPDGANITTAAGDSAWFVSEGSSNWKCVGYQRATPHAGWEDVGIFNPSAQQSIDITGLSAYSMLRVEGYLVPATDATQLGLRTSTNNGSSFDNGASDYGWIGHYSNGSAVASVADPDDSWISLTCGQAIIGNVSTEGIHFDLLMTRFNASNRMLLSGTVTIVRDAGVLQPVQISGWRLSTTARDAFQFRFNTGNIAVGKVSVQGLRG